MKHIRTFESYKTTKAGLKVINTSILEECIKESVITLGDTYKVRSLVDIPQSLINKYVSKVKEETGKNLRQFLGDVEIAEEIVKHVTTSGLDIDKIAGSAILGGPQGQEEAQVQPQVQPQGQAETQPEVQTQVQVDTQVESQPVEGQEFEEPIQGEEDAQPVEGQEFEEPIQGEEDAQPVEGQDEEEEEEELPL